jgi:branched-chain amino acid transport system permease protein/neutral amino acid transport system permease protein
MFASTLAEGIGFGLVAAAVIALGAVGLSIQLSVTNYINFAFGDLMSLGAYFVITFNLGLHMNFYLAALIGAIVLGILFVILNVVVLRPFVRGGARVFTLLVVTIGVSFVVQNGTLLIWGPGAYQYTVNVGNAMHIGPLLLTPGDLIIIATAVFLVLGLQLFLQYTKLGKALRATSNNVDLAMASGINTDLVVNMTWAISGFFAAVAGVALAVEQNNLRPLQGFNQLLVIFAAIILGGIGRQMGALLGALVIGLATAITGLFLPSGYDFLVAFALLILVLLLRPQGILTGREVVD